MKWLRAKFEGFDPEMIGGAVGISLYILAGLACGFGGFWDGLAWWAFVLVFGVPLTLAVIWRVWDTVASKVRRTRERRSERQP